MNDAAKAYAKQWDYLMIICGKCGCENKVITNDFFADKHFIFECEHCKRKKVYIARIIIQDEITKKMLVTGKYTFNEPFVITY